MKNQMLRKIILAAFALTVLTGTAFAKSKLIKENIPQIYGKAKNATEGASDLTVIHIQDAHGNIEAQENIENIIKHLAEKGKVDAITDEAGWSQYQYPGYENFSQEDRELAADFFTKYALIHGCDRYVINHNLEMPVFGNEDKETYFKGKKQFQTAHANKKESLAAAETIKAQLEALKLKLFSEEERAFLQTLEDFDADKITLTTYAKELKNKAVDFKVNWNNYNNFAKVIKSIELEDKINFAKIDKERINLVDEIQNKVSKKMADEIVSKSLNFRLGRLAAAEYYSFLMNQAKSAKIDMKNFGNANLYAQLVQVYADIDDDAIFAESERLENAVKAKMFKTDAQVQFNSHFMNMNNMINLINVQMTRADIAYFNKNKPSAAKTLAFLKAQGMEVNDAFSKIDNSVKNNLDFYQTAMKRDEIMVEKTLAMMDEKGFKTVVLVAGGFHTEGIIKKFEAAKVNHVTITPRITGSDTSGHDNYLKLKLGEANEATTLVKDTTGFDYFKEMTSNTESGQQPKGEGPRNTLHINQAAMDAIKAINEGTSSETLAGLSDRIAESILETAVTTNSDNVKALEDVFSNDRIGLINDLKGEETGIASVSVVEHSDYLFSSKNINVKGIGDKVFQAPIVIDENGNAYISSKLNNLNDTNFENFMNEIKASEAKENTDNKKSLEVNPQNNLKLHLMTSALEVSNQNNLNDNFDRIEKSTLDIGKGIASFEQYSTIQNELHNRDSVSFENYVNNLEELLAVGDTANLLEEITIDNLPKPSSSTIIAINENVFTTYPMEEEEGKIGAKYSIDAESALNLKGFQSGQIFFMETADVSEKNDKIQALTGLLIKQYNMSVKLATSYDEAKKFASEQDTFVIMAGKKSLLNNEGIERVAFQEMTGYNQTNFKVDNAQLIEYTVDRGFAPVMFFNKEGLTTLESLNGYKAGSITENELNKPYVKMDNYFERITKVLDAMRNSTAATAWMA